MEMEGIHVVDGLPVEDAGGNSGDSDSSGSDDEELRKRLDLLRRASGKQKARTKPKAKSQRRHLRKSKFEENLKAALSNAGDKSKKDNDYRLGGMNVAMTAAMGSIPKNQEFWSGWAQWNLIFLHLSPLLPLPNLSRQREQNQHLLVLLVLGSRLSARSMHGGTGRTSAGSFLWRRRSRFILVGAVAFLDPSSRS